MNERFDQARWAGMGIVQVAQEIGGEIGRKVAAHALRVEIRRFDAR